MVTAKKFVLVKHFEGEPKPDDLKLETEELPAIQDGEYLVEAEYLSVDPYMRPYSARYPLGTTMIGSQIAKIIESKNPDFPVGMRVSGYMGWRTHTIVNMEGEHVFDSPPRLLPEMKTLMRMRFLSPSLGLGVMGMPGYTAYFGFLEVCKPRAGETLVVTGAAGAVGSHVGQIGRIMGLTVIGITGSDEKCQWLTEELRFDHAINYKTQNVEAELKKVAPNGVDCFFDNVGGEIASTIIYQMNAFGRVSICGSISAYNNDASEYPKATIIQPAAVSKQLKIEGFLVWRWADRFSEAFKTNLEWIQKERLLYRETVTEGFENMFKAFAGMLKGENIGKAIVKP
ncbi:prostaglandin reductase 1 [Diachasma alloeum]|uniref:prostaglandin reductase 1 n=1 Tax=Diachasma alloeum TaxID=454923 RepID=UPI00073819AC|nr:prostaglandin reductase 1 [Diachasma alloeum]